MNFNYTLKYKTFDSLLEDIRSDWKAYALEGKIEPQQLIKVALRVNYDLGLRINQPKERVLTIEHGRAKLPDDFYVMNFALLCGEHTQTIVPGQGTHIEEIAVPLPLHPIEPDPCTDPIINACCPTKTPNTMTPICLTRCGTGMQLVQTINSFTRTYKYMHPIRFKNSHQIDCKCPNLNMLCHDEAFLRDGFIWTAYNNHGHKNHQGSKCENGGLYINYEGALEDDDGNILVPDHPMLNEYYEYALKQRVLENMMMDGDSLLNPQIQLVEARLKAARNNALTIVNMPNFSEMQKLHDTVRKAYYSRYYDMFKSYAPTGPRFQQNNAL
jgi:hypothetical protein